MPLSTDSGTWRPWPTADEIAAAQSETHGFDRSWSRFDLSDCTHGISRCVEIEEGWAVNVCTNCGHVERLPCQHPASEWNREGTLLRCITCGEDGT